MPYYSTIEEDLTRAKQILEKGRATHDMIESLPEPARPAARVGGTIFGADVYASYKLLESFVAAIEAVGPKVCELALRHDRQAGRYAEECVCRTRCCGHTASQHHNGVCEVCNAGLCWC